MLGLRNNRWDNEWILQGVVSDVAMVTKTACLSKWWSGRPMCAPDMKLFPKSPFDKARYSPTNQLPHSLSIPCRDHNLDIAHMLSLYSSLYVSCKISELEVNKPLLIWHYHLAFFFLSNMPRSLIILLYVTYRAARISGYNIYIYSIMCGLE